MKRSTSQQPKQEKTAKESFDSAIFRNQATIGRSRQVNMRGTSPIAIEGIIPPEKAGEVLYFDLKGVWTSEEIKSSCKYIKHDNTIKYFVKFCIEGADRGHALNPYSIYFKEGDQQRMESRRGRMRYEYRLVTETAFNNYLKFLQTRAVSYLYATEREVLNHG